MADSVARKLVARRALRGQGEGAPARRCSRPASRRPSSWSASSRFYDAGQRGLAALHRERAARAPPLQARQGVRRRAGRAGPEVVIVDEFTGRKMAGRRWSDGLHQAVEAKEGLPTAQENQTLATITFQNYFRLFKKLAGMTGTALTEAGEFHKIYSLDVVQIPTNLPLVARRPATTSSTAPRRRSGRRSSTRSSACTRRASRSWSARPRSRSPSCSRACSSRRGIEHEVLNAKNHEREAAHRRARRRAGRGDGRDEHGRPRHGHQARRQLRVPPAQGARGGRPRARATSSTWPRSTRIRAARARAVRPRPGGGARARRPLRARHRAPRGAPHRQPAARPLGPPGRRRASRASTCRCRTT